jgi:hypothetical protein
VSSATLDDAFTGRARAKQAMVRARALWPGVHGEVLCEEIEAGYILRWLGPSARTVRLIDDILATPEASR